MPQNAEEAIRLKTEGNNFFTSGNFISAESLYSKAIIADDTNASLYTNRAMARIKLNLYDSAISDCRACLKLDENSMKGTFILSQCLLAIHDYDGALETGLRAHKMGSTTNDKSLPNLTQQVLRCKREIWEAREKRRIRETQQLENETIALMERERDDMVATGQDAGEQNQIREEWDQKIELLRATFDRARTASERKRESPPAWAVDDITFDIMVDPVMTKTGKSYERASIVEAIKRQPLDPITREPLRFSDLRPNLALKEACEEYIRENGWAVDW
ncbi:U-box domain-containing protein [Xylariaceae sp. FL1272]|nr:U-box domain-containing protein [Xylariaceae sp. FL1272]